MSKGIIYNPVPPRVWSRVQNPYSTDKILNTNPDDMVFVPLMDEYIKYRNVQTEMQMLEKGNILQYKNNSANLTKKQKYSQIAKGYGSSRKKCYASQTQTVTNPNTSSFARVNFRSIPYPNIIVGKPNNTAGPFQVNTPDPFECNTDILKDGGNLVGNTIVNPCTGEIEQLFRQEKMCYPSSCSGVPGKPIDLCWRSSIQTWFPRKRYVMNNSLDKWPTNYKGLKVSAVTPAPPILTLLSSTTKSIEISWTAIVSDILPLTKFNIYVNGNFYSSVSSKELYVTTIENIELFTTFTEIPPINSNSLTKTINDKDCNDLDPTPTPDPKPNPVVATPIIIHITSQAGHLESDISNILQVDSFNDNVDTTSSDGDNEEYQNLKCTARYYNALLNNNVIVEINTFLLDFICNIGKKDNIPLDFSKFNELNIDLHELIENVDETCVFSGILDIYKNILYCLYDATKNKVENYDKDKLIGRLEKDSIILHDMDKLKAYIKNLQKRAAGKGMNVNIVTELFKVKPEFVEYIKLYGYPSNGIYEPKLLDEILDRLKIGH